MGLIKSESKYMLSGFFVKYGSIDHNTGQILVDGEFYLPYAPIAINGNNLYIKNIGILKIENVYYIVEDTPNNPQSFTQNTVLFIEGKMKKFENPECIGAEVVIKGINDCETQQIKVDISCGYSFIQIFEAETENGSYICIGNHTINNPETGTDLLFDISTTILEPGNFYIVRVQNLFGEWIESIPFQLTSFEPCPPPPPTTEIVLTGFNDVLKAVNFSILNGFTKVDLYESTTEFGTYNFVSTLGISPSPNTGIYLDEFAGLITAGNWYYLITLDSLGFPISSTPNVQA